MDANIYILIYFKKKLGKDTVQIAKAFEVQADGYINRYILVQMHIDFISMKFIQEDMHIKKMQ